MHKFKPLENQYFFFYIYANCPFKYEKKLKQILISFGGF